MVDDRVFQALADPSRRAIFVSLARGEAAVKDLWARFDISQPAVSQRRAALKAAGLVNGRREGRCVYYRVEPRGTTPSGTRLVLVHSGFNLDQAQNFGGARRIP